MWSQTNVVGRGEMIIYSTCLFQFVQLVIMDSRIVCRVAPDKIPIQRPFPLKFNQKANEAEMGIPQR